MTEKNPENISIIIPVYNEELAIKSVLENIYTAINGLAYNCEVLVIHDGSTDNTVEISEKFPGSEAQWQVRLYDSQKTS